jgi:hypothetical protein
MNIFYFSLYQISFQLLLNPNTVLKALNVVVKWAAKEGLNINPHKTAIVPFTNKRILEGLGPLIINGKELKMLDEVKYLGVTLD